MERRRLRSQQRAGTKVAYIPELVRSIFKVADNTTLTRCARVCRTWNKIANEILWHTIPLSKDFNNHGDYVKANKSTDRLMALQKFAEHWPNRMAELSAFIKRVDWPGEVVRNSALRYGALAKAEVWTNARLEHLKLRNPMSGGNRQLSQQAQHDEDMGMAQFDMLMVQSRETLKRVDLHNPRGSALHALMVFGSLNKTDWLQQRTGSTLRRVTISHNAMGVLRQDEWALLLRTLASVETLSLDQLAPSTRFLTGFIEGEVGLVIAQMPELRDLTLCGEWCLGRFIFPENFAVWPKLTALCTFTIAGWLLSRTERMEQLKSIEMIYVKRPQTIRDLDPFYFLNQMRHCTQLDNVSIDLVGYNGPFPNDLFNRMLAGYTNITRFKLANALDSMLGEFEAHSCLRVQTLQILLRHTRLQTVEIQHPVLTNTREAVHVFLQHCPRLSRLTFKFLVGTVGPYNYGASLIMLPLKLEELMALPPHRLIQELVVPFDTQAVDRRPDRNDIMLNFARHLHQRFPALDYIAQYGKEGVETRSDVTLDILSQHLHDMNVRERG